MDDQTPSNPNESNNTPAAVVAHGLAVFEHEATFNQWLDSEIWALSGVRPRSLLSTAAGRAQVRGILYRIEWGIFS